MHASEKKELVSEIKELNDELRALIRSHREEIEVLYFEIIVWIQKSSYFSNTQIKNEIKIEKFDGKWKCDETSENKEEYGKQFGWSFFRWMAGYSYYIGLYFYIKLI